MGGKRPRDGHALPHAARKLARKGILEPLEADEVDQMRDMLGGGGQRPAQDLQRHLDIAPDAAPRQQRGVLKGDPRQPVARSVERCLARDADLARVGRLEPHGDAHRRRLAAAGGADDRGEGPLRAGQGDVAQGLDHPAPPGEGLADPGQGDPIRGRHQISSRRVVSNMSRLPTMPTSPRALRFRLDVVLAHGKIAVRMLHQRRLRVVEEKLVLDGAARAGEPRVGPARRPEIRVLEIHVPATPRGPEPADQHVALLGQKPPPSRPRCRCRW